MFAGRFTLEDVESVCTYDDVPPVRALDLLSSLVDKSLVVKEDANRLACYRLHETMREYAGLKLREAGEDEVVERRCAEYYGSRCRRAAAEARYRLLEWLEWMDLEIDNVRSVLRRCLIHLDPRGVDLAASLGWYWITRATTEGVRWLDELLASGRGTPEAHGCAYFMRGFLAVLQADPTAARPALAQAVAVGQETGQLPLLSQSLYMASIAENMARDRASARRLLDLFGGDLDASKPLFAEALRIAHQIDDRVAQYYLLDALGCHAASSGQARLAAQLLGAAETIRSGAGASVMAVVTPLLARAEESAIAARGASMFGAEFNAGRGMSRDAAIGLALGEPARVAATASDGGGAGLLGKREADVARLVAEGMSNKQIGARLFMSERTVEGHVRSVLNKLGFHTRAQIAGWMASSNP